MPFAKTKNLLTIDWASEFKIKTGMFSRKAIDRAILISSPVRKNRFMKASFKFWVVCLFKGIRSENSNTSGFSATLSLKPEIKVLLNSAGDE
jgi:hypothetical protein